MTTSCEMLVNTSNNNWNVAQAVGPRLVGVVAAIGLLVIALSGCGDNKQGSDASKSPQFNQLVMQTFQKPELFKLSMNFSVMCTEVKSPAIKTVIDGVAHGRVPADPSRILPAVFAQVDFVCENNLLGFRKPATAWVGVAYDKEFDTIRCQWVFTATEEPFEAQFAHLSQGCKFVPSSGAVSPSPIFHVLK